MDKECRRRLTTMEASHGISPYCLPVINNFVTPVPPATKRKERGAKVTQSSTLRGRRLRPTTGSSGVDITEVFVSRYVLLPTKAFLTHSQASVFLDVLGKPIEISMCCTKKCFLVFVFLRSKCLYRTSFPKPD